MLPNLTSEGRDADTAGQGYRYPRRRLILIALGLTAVAAASRIPSFVSASASRAEGPGTPRDDAIILAVTFSSAWCGPCRILKPRLAQARATSGDLPVRYLELDFTFGNKQMLRDIAYTERFGDVFERYKSATGFTLLIDPVSGTVVDMLTMDYSEKAMAAALHRAVSLATGTTARETPGI